MDLPSESVTKNRGFQLLSRSRMKIFSRLAGGCIGLLPLPSRMSTTYREVGLVMIYSPGSSAELAIMKVDGQDELRQIVERLSLNRKHEAPTWPRLDVESKTACSRFLSGGWGGSPRCVMKCTGSEGVRRGTDRVRLK